MDEKNTQELRHPANAVFALMEDREFRHGIIRTAVEKDKTALSRLATGKHQLKGFRHIEKAPTVMLIPVLSDEANESADLAKEILTVWLADSQVLRGKVATRLQELGYEPVATPFDEEDLVGWKPLHDEHAKLQYEGTFLEGESKDAVMLMSLLLGWFGSDREPDAEEAE